MSWTFQLKNVNATGNIDQQKLSRSGTYIDRRYDKLISWQVYSLIYVKLKYSYQYLPQIFNLG